MSLSEFIDSATSPQVLWTILWIGLAVLTFTLLALMRTTWGQARPLAKCVVLSVFAHMLLVHFAYMTDLFVVPLDDAPGQHERNDTLQVRIVSGDEQALLEQPKYELPAWEKHVPEQSLAPEEMTLDREAPSLVEPPTERVEQARPEMAVSVPSDMPLPEFDADPGDHSLPTNSLHAETTGATAPEIEAPLAERRDDAVPTGPNADALSRAEGQFNAASSPQRSLPRDIPAELMAATPDLQRLADLPDTRDPSPTVSAPQDITASITDRTLPQLAHITNPSIAPGQTMPAETIRPQPGEGGSDEIARIASGAAGTAIASSAGIDAQHRAIASGEMRTGSPPRLANGRTLPTPYQLRAQPQRAEIAAEQGGNARTEAAVKAALEWLAANQEADGRWDADKHGAGREARVLGHDRGGAGAQADTGVTALATLAFMAAGHTHLEGDYRKNVQRGLEFLLRSQGRDGSLAGNAETFAAMYCHGMASLAISEAYALTGDDRIKPGVERAIGYTIAAQSTADGGWRYRPGDTGDMSQFGWQLMALKSAELAGIEVPARTREGMQRFLASVTSGRQGGLASYRPREGVTPTMTAEALSCRFFMGIPSDDPAVDEAANYLVERTPDRDKANFYYWYYGTMAMHQVQGERWDKWNEALQGRLLSSQRKDGAHTGTWDAGPDMWGSYGGRVYTTALGALCLESYYRFTPLRSASR